MPKRITTRALARLPAGPNVRHPAARDNPSPSPFEVVLQAMSFEPLDDGRTLVSISEEGWRPTDAALQASYGNCHGWTQMLCALKAWLEHGINLREGMYK
jgi:uncharacterized protein YndB with AHSA1/START domain